MKVYFDNRPCGSGKTYGELLHMVSNKGKYLLAVDRKEAMRDREKEIQRLARKAGKRVATVVLMSGDHNHQSRAGSTTFQVSTSVRTAVAGIPFVHDIDHIVVIISHEALKLADLDGFAGWHLVIDETPSILDQQALQTDLTRDFFERHYKLNPKGKRAEVTSISQKTAADLRRDTLASPITVMHSRVLSDRSVVLTDVMDWKELGEDGQWTWASIWSPDQLSVFSSVLILANAFDRSLTYAILKRVWPEIEWVPHQRLALRKYRRRTMLIRYFAEKHMASRSLFSSDVGKDRLAKVARWISDEVEPASHIWTCNQADASVLQKHLSSPSRLSPRQAGSNAYAAATTVSAIYTAKATPAERTLFRDLGIDPHVATETREFETIFQFVCRCAVRDPGNDQNLKVHVYDRNQAAYLAELFAATGYVDATMELIDLGFADALPPRGKPGPKIKPKSAAEKAAGDEKARSKARDRKRRQRARNAMAQDQMKENSAQRRLWAKGRR